MFRCSTARSIISAFLAIALGMALAAPYRVVAEEGAPGVSEGPRSAAVSQDHTILGKTRVDLDYVFSSGSSHIELDLPKPQPEDEVEEQDLEGFLEAIEGDPAYEQQDRVYAPSLGGGSARSDFVGDRGGAGGIGSDTPVWLGTYTDTLYRTQAVSVPRSGHSGTSFENGYIPAYDEAPRDVDDVPVADSYVDTARYSRLPSDWAVPPGGARRGVEYGDTRRYYEDFPAYTGDGPYRRNYYGDPASGYRYDQGHHPEGAYSYRFGVQDPFWTEERRNYHEEAGFSVQAGWPIFRRGFDPEEADLKVGPAYFQVVSVEAGVLYSDYDGPRIFAPGREDGFLSFVGLRLRATSRIAANLFFEIDGEVIYLPGVNQVGLRTVGGIGEPFLSLNYLTEWGEWDIRIYDELGTYLPFDFRANDDAFDRAGRYHFGWEGLRSARTWEVFDPVIYNRVGIQATRPTTPDWRLTLEADHTDYYYIDSDRSDQHRSLEHVGALLSAEPGKVPFSPYAEYDSWWDSDSDYVYHTMYVGGRGRLTERVDADARVGYFWGDFDRGANRVSREAWLWRIGLRHQVAENTSHGVYVGQDHFINEFSGNSLVSEYVHYYIRHEISERLGVGGFAQWSRDNFQNQRLRGTDFDREVYGVRVRYAVSENVRADAGYRLEQYERVRGRDRAIFHFRLNARLAERTSCYFHYQFEDAEIFDEDRYMVGVRRYF